MTHPILIVMLATLVVLVMLAVSVAAILVSVAWDAATDTRLGDSSAQ